MTPVFSSDVDEVFEGGRPVRSVPVTRDVTEAANAARLRAKADLALRANATYLSHAPVPSGTLTAAVLSGIVRQLTDQVDLLTRQAQALIRLQLDQLDTDDA